VGGGGGPGRSARVGDLERNPDVTGDGAPDLDLVDVRGVRRIGELVRSAEAGRSKR